LIKRSTKLMLYGLLNSIEGLFVILSLYAYLEFFRLFPKYSIYKYSYLILLAYFMLFSFHFAWGILLTAFHVLFKFSKLSLLTPFLAALWSLLPIIFYKTWRLQATPYPKILAVLTALVFLFMLIILIVKSYRNNTYLYKYLKG
jgi:hypothetical protein